MNIYKYFCEKCQYGTNLKYSIIQHNNTGLHKTGERIHKKKENKKIYECEHCPYYKTSYKNNYLTHMLNNHDNAVNRKKSFKFYCECCDFGVFTKSSFDKHLETLLHQKKITFSKNAKIGDKNTPTNSIATKKK